MAHKVNAAQPRAPADVPLAALALGLVAAQRACTIFSVRVTALSIQNTNMKQYVTSLALVIAALVAFPTSHANAQSQAEMNPKRQKTSRRPMQNSIERVRHLWRSFQKQRASENLRKVSELGLHSEMLKQRSQLIRRVAGRRLLQFATEP